MTNKFYSCCILMLAACQMQTQSSESSIHSVHGFDIKYKSIEEIPVPEGYQRMEVETGSFAEWLRGIAFKEDDRVFLYNGSLKSNQTAQYAVLDVPVGNKDLQQCADAIMRLNAEFYFLKKDFNAIAFHATDGTLLSFAEWRKGKRFKLSGSRLQSYFVATRSIDARVDLENYLEMVFTYAGTTSLASELQPVKNSNDVKAGDVFIKPGFPGHAMLIADVAINSEGGKIFMLAQGYMPAQDIHLVKNPANEDGNPWYKTSGEIETPEWIFRSSQLKRKN